MYSMPIGVIPKPCSTDFHLVMDHSAGEFALNNYIAKSDSSIRLDSLQDFGTALRAVIACDGHTSVWLFKSDVSAAYRRIPMHPLWQLKQINTFQGMRHIDRNMTFGSHSAPKIWCSFFSLVIWISIHILVCMDLLHYMDDTWSYETDPALVYYELYDSHFPKKQATLLCLYDHLSLPHTKNKQIFGHALDIISLHIDPSSMSIMMPLPARRELVAAIRSFISTTTSCHRSLLDWQRILRWINWGLNAFPLGRPALQSAYDKVSGKLIPRAKIYLNHAVIRDLTWLALMIEASDGIHMMDVIKWDESQANLTIYCDASLEGLSFVTPSLKLGFSGPMPTDSCLQMIFFFES